MRGKPILETAGPVDPNNSSQTEGLAWKGGVGMFHFLNEHFAAVTEVNYLQQEYSSSSVNTFGITLGFGRTTTEARLAAQQAEEEEFRLRLAETSLAVETNDWSLRGRLQEQATAAAINPTRSTRRSDSPPSRAASMGTAMARTRGHVFPNASRAEAAP